MARPALDGVAVAAWLRSWAVPAVRGGAPTVRLGGAALTVRAGGAR